MGVVQVVDTLDAGGYERVAVDLANELAGRGIPSYLCATRRGGHLEQGLKGNVKYFSLERRSTLDIGSIVKFRNWIKKEGINVVHAHGISTAMFCAVSMIGSKTDLIHHDHNPLIEKRNRWRENILLGNVSAWICVSDPIYRWANEVIHYDSPVLIKNPIDVDRFHGHNTKVKGKVRFVHLANYKPHKDHWNLIKAIELVSKESDNFKVDCYGTNYDSPYCREIRELVVNNKLSHLVEIHDTNQDVSELLSGACAGILSSEAEGLPISLLEYLASDLPVIVTDVGDCALVVEKSKAGIVVPSKDPESLSRAFLEFIRNYSKWNDLAKNGNEYVRLHHSIQHFADEMVAIYVALKH